MARPTKQGIDYFSLDVNFDDKTELYLIETEAIGLAVMITLWQLIYQNEGYYINYTDDLHLLIKRRINVDINTIDECINTMFKRCILNQPLYEKYGILTSKAIQKRYFDAAKRKKVVKVDKKYLLINLSNYENIVNININTIDVNINTIDVVGNATKEEVEGEVKEEGDKVTSKKRKTQIPKNYSLSEKHINYAKSKGFPTETIPEIFEKFCNHHASKGSTFLDWDRAWYTWVQNQIQFYGIPKPEKEGWDI